MNFRVVRRGRGALGVDGRGNVPSDVTHYALETLCRCVRVNGVLAARQNGDGRRSGVQ